MESTQQIKSRHNDEEHAYYISHEETHNAFFFTWFSSFIHGVRYVPMLTKAVSRETTSPAGVRRGTVSQEVHPSLLDNTSRNIKRTHLNIDATLSYSSSSTSYNLHIYCT